MGDFAPKLRPNFARVVVPGADGVTRPPFRDSLWRPQSLRCGYLRALRGDPRDGKVRGYPALDISHHLFLPKVVDAGHDSTHRKVSMSYLLSLRARKTADFHLPSRGSLLGVDV
jgi:hypothetical protein